MPFNDLDKSSAKIGEYSPSASVRFLHAAQKAFGLLADISGIGAPRDYNNPAAGYAYAECSADVNHRSQIATRFRPKDCQPRA